MKQARESWRLLGFALITLAGAGLAVEAKPPLPGRVAVHLAADAIPGLAQGCHVALWPDISGNRNHAIQPAVRHRPTYLTGQINGKPVVRFDPEDRDGADWLTITSARGLDGPSKTWFLVARQQDRNTTSDEFLLRSDCVGRAYCWGEDANADGFFRSSVITDRFRSVRQPCVAGKFYIVAGVWDGSKGTLVQYLNGVTSATVHGVADSAMRRHSATYIGGDSTGRRYFDGDIAEVIVWNEALKPEDVIAVIRYLGAKYGIHTPYAQTLRPRKGQVGELAGAQIRWTAPRPDTSRPDDAGYPLIPSKLDIEIYHGRLIAEGGLGTYNHGGHMIHHRGRFYVTWKSHDRYEDAPGQRTLCCVSRDGLSWSSPTVIVDSISPMGPRNQNGYFVFACPFQAVAERLYAFATVLRRRGSRYERIGKVGVRLDADGRANGVPFWVDLPKPENAPPACRNYVRRPDLSGQTRQDVEKIVQRWRRMGGDSSSLSYGPNRGPAPGTPYCRLSEHTAYFTADGLHQVMLWRDDAGCALWAAVRPVRKNSKGRIVGWYGHIYPTNIPDAQTWNYALNLPDGQVCLVGSHYPQRLHRYPLTIALSADGVHFDRVWAVRTGTAPIRYPDAPYKCLGYQYPAAILVGDYLWIAYSVNKEDIAITRVPLKYLSADRSSRNAP